MGIRSIIKGIDLKTLALLLDENRSTGRTTVMQMGIAGYLNQFPEAKIILYVTNQSHGETLVGDAGFHRSNRIILVSGGTENLVKATRGRSRQYPIIMEHDIQREYIHAGALQIRELERQLDFARGVADAKRALIEAERKRLRIIEDQLIQLRFRPLWKIAIDRLKNFIKERRYPDANN